MGTGYIDFFPFFLPGTNKADLVPMLLQPEMGKAL